MVRTKIKPGLLHTECVLFFCSFNNMNDFFMHRTVYLLTQLQYLRFVKAQSSDSESESVMFSSLWTALILSELRFLFILLIFSLEYSTNELHFICSCLFIWNMLAVWGGMGDGGAIKSSADLDLIGRRFRLLNSPLNLPMTAYITDSCMGYDCTPPENSRTFEEMNFQRLSW